MNPSVKVEKLTRSQQVEKKSKQSLQQLSMIL